MRRCRHSTEAAAHQQLERCLAVEEPPCLERCPGGGGGGDGCAGACRSEARARCEADARRECLGACGRHVCAPHGRCECPVFLRGDSMCTDYSWLRGLAPQPVAFCFQSIFEDEFLTSKFGETSDPRAPPSLLLRDNSTGGAAAEANRRFVDGLGTGGGSPSAAASPFPDLGDLADFSSCAVVGSSGALGGSGLGAEIDSHGAVIRFNDAPTRGFEADVGSRTTLRVQNNQYCGFCEDAAEILLPYTVTNLSKYCFQREEHPDCNVYSSSDQLRNYVSRFFEPLLLKFARNSTWHKGDLMQELAEENNYLAGAAAAPPMADASNSSMVNDAMPDTQGRHDLSPKEELRRKRRYRQWLRHLEEMRIVTQRVNGTLVHLKDISAGMTGIIMAMHMCYEVDVYGFTQSGAYYYPKV